MGKDKEFRRTPAWTLPSGVRRVRRRWACNLLVFLLAFLLLAHYVARQHTSVMNAFEHSLQRAQKIQADQLQSAVEISKKRSEVTLDQAPSWAETVAKRSPYTQPGYLNVSFEDPLGTKWIPHSPASSPPDWLNTLRSADNSPVIPWSDWNGAQPSFTREKWQKRELDSRSTEQRSRIQREALESVGTLCNSTILLLGDSLDRNFVDQFAWLTQAIHGQESFLGESFDKTSIKSWGLPHNAIIESDINLKIANLFFYGAMDEEGEFSDSADWLPPAKAEDRIEELFKPYSERLAHPVRLIQFNAGLWDLAFFGRVDKDAGLGTDHPLSPERMAAWRARTRSVIRKVKETWPGVPILFRKMHRIGDKSGPSSDYGGRTNFFTNARVHQMRHLQQLVAEEEGLAIWDFGEAFEGYQQYADKVHPHLNPGGTLMAQALLHHLHLARSIEDGHLDE